jgi:hypothetical protein
MEQGKTLTIFYQPVLSIETIQEEDKGHKQLLRLLESEKIQMKILELNSKHQ